MPPLSLAISAPPTSVWIATVASYLLGAIPFGLCLGLWLKRVDIRQEGSKNIGATNAMRILGKPLGITAFVLDLAKGVVPILVLVPLATSEEHAALARLACGAAAVLGHCFPVYLGFRGGKGVATGCGAIVAVEPLVFVIGGGVWIITLLGFRMVGLASMTMGTTFPLAAWWLRPEDGPFLIGCALLATLIWIRHRANLGRMLRGVEPRIGRRDG